MWWHIGVGNSLSRAACHRFGCAVTVRIAGGNGDDLAHLGFGQKQRAESSGRKRLTATACGLGVGIIASMAFDPMSDLGLRKIEAGHLFGPNTTMMAFRRGQILKRYAYRFAQLCTQTLQPDDLRRQVESAPTWQG